MDPDQLASDCNKTDQRVNRPLNSADIRYLSVTLVNRPLGYTTFSCSAQLSTSFQLIIKTKIPTNEEIFCFKSLRCCIYHANKC